MKMAFYAGFLQTAFRPVLPKCNGLFSNAVIKGVQSSMEIEGNLC